MQLLLLFYNWHINQSLLHLSPSTKTSSFRVFCFCFCIPKIAVMVEAAAVVIALAISVLAWLVTVTLRSIFGSPGKPKKYQPRNVGDITSEELSKCNGLDPRRPILVALRGKVYDVSEARNFYGPGGGYHVYAGREAARALGKMAIAADECTSKVDDLTPKEMATLEQWEAKFAAKYSVVGRVTAPKELTLKQLAAYDGTDPSKPMYLAVRGVIFDVTSGQAYYGPSGSYPFAGKECARALAKISTELSDCNDNLEGCTLTEMDALRDWEGLFHTKYSVVGRIV